MYLEERKGLTVCVSRVRVDAIYKCVHNTHYSIAMSISIG
jgi:hypothetical protein